MFAHACKLGLEGVVSKVRDSAYASGRGNNWVKKTCAQRETLTIAGFARDEGKWNGIYVGRRRAMLSSTLGRSTTASTRSPPPTCGSVWSHSFARRSPTQNGSPIRASGSSRNYSPRSSTGQNRRSEKSGTRSSEDCGRTLMDAFDHILAAGGLNRLRRPDRASSYGGRLRRHIKLDGYAFWRVGRHCHASAQLSDQALYHLEA
jgi:hypothetical protein